MKVRLATVDSRNISTTRRLELVERSARRPCRSATRRSCTSTTRFFIALSSSPSSPLPSSSQSSTRRAIVGDREFPVAAARDWNALSSAVVCQNYSSNNCVQATDKNAAVQGVFDDDRIRLHRPQICENTFSCSVSAIFLQYVTLLFTIINNKQSVVGQLGHYHPIKSLGYMPVPLYHFLPSLLRIIRLSLCVCTSYRHCAFCEHVYPPQKADTE